MLVFNDTHSPIAQETYDLRIPPELLDARLPRETHTTTPLNSRARDLLRDPARIQLRHRRFLHEALSLLLPPSSVICQQACCSDACRGVGDLEGEPLEGADGLPELGALVCVWDGFVEGALGEADHLRCNAYPA